MKVKKIMVELGEHIGKNIVRKDNNPFKTPKRTVELVDEELRTTLNALEVLMEISSSPEYEIASRLFIKPGEVNKMTIKGTVELDVDELGHLTLKGILDHVHLCKYCENEFGECIGDARYGTGYGNDNVCLCSGFK